ncbi:MAG: hypothetical protein ABL966_12705 [Acidimicrobiales bacterium]
MGTEDLPAEVLESVGDVLHAWGLAEKYGIDGAERMLRIEEWDADCLVALEVLNGELGRLEHEDDVKEAAERRRKAKR